MDRFSIEKDIIDKDNRENREKLLDAQWENLMPCATCCIEDVCRYKNVIKRIDYPADVFSVNVGCKIKNNYRRTDN